MILPPPPSPLQTAAQRRRTREEAERQQREREAAEAERIAREAREAAERRAAAERERLSAEERAARAKKSWGLGIAGAKCVAFRPPCSLSETATGFQTREPQPDTHFYLCLPPQDDWKDPRQPALQRRGEEEDGGRGVGKAGECWSPNSFQLSLHLGVRLHVAVWSGSQSEGNVVSSFASYAVVCSSTVQEEERRRQEEEEERARHREAVKQR